MAENTTGVWLDKDTGKVVHKKPSRARQIVAPGVEIGTAEQALIDLYQDNSDTTAAELVDAPPRSPRGAEQADAVDEPTHHEGSAAKKAPAKKTAAKK